MTGLVTSQLLMVLVTPLWVSATVFYPIDEPDIVHYCPNDHVAFEVNITTPLAMFGTSVSTLYMSNLGFLSDVYNDYTVVPQKFPLSGSSSHALGCVGERCWLDHYYSPSDVADIQAQNYPNDCVNGQSITEVFDYLQDFSYLKPIDSPSRTLNPANCFSSNIDPPPNEDFNWMIASYWQNLDVRYLESILSHLETTESSVLDQARQDVESLDTVSSFTPTLAVIFTWSGISFYNGFYYGYPEADFQIVLTTDGVDTFAIYNYDALPFGGAQGGFDAGDDTNYCSFLLSRSEGSTAWTQMSNIGINGRMVLRMGNGYDNSVCEPLRDNVPSCLCDDGWEGIICAASIDDCINNNCPADAECVDGHLTYTCNYCVNVTCENEGVCMNNATAQSYYCDCVGNYTGVHCEQCLTLTCENGGVCSNNATSGENTCTCAEGYSGSTCQNQIIAEESKAGGGLSDAEIIGIAVGAALGAVAAALLIYLAARRGKKNQEEDKVAPLDRNQAWTTHA